MNKRVYYKLLSAIAFFSTIAVADVAKANSLNFDADGGICDTITRFSYENGVLYAMTEDTAYFPTTFDGPQKAKISSGPFNNTFYVSTEFAVYTIIDNVIIPYKVETVDEYRNALKEGNVDVVTMEKCEQ